MAKSLSKTPPVQVLVKTKEGTPAGALMTGMNTQLFINGQKFPYAKSFKFEVDAKGIAKCQIEFYGQVMIDGTVANPKWKGIKKGE